MLRRFLFEVALVLSAVLLVQACGPSTAHSELTQEGLAAWELVYDSGLYYSDHIYRYHLKNGDVCYVDRVHQGVGISCKFNSN
jgi:hypothetical protein